MSSAITVLVIVVVAFPLLMYLMQDQLLFHPQPLNEAQRKQIQARFAGVEEVVLQAEGARLHAWHVKGQPGKPLVIYFGGNAEDVSWMIEEGRSRVPSVGWLLVSYRGYGGSEGSPSETVITADALRWYDYAVKELGATKVIAFGRSLGSGAAVALAAQRPLAGVILVSPFDSLAAVAKRYYWYLPVDWMLKHRFDSIALAPGLKTPLLALIAERDEVIPPVHAGRLFDAWGGSKRKVVLAGASHNATDGHPGFWPAIRQFLEEQDK